MALTFVLSDESVNSYGTRILTSGIDLSLFKKNPIMLWMHQRAWRGQKDEVLPIGRWENIRKENSQLLADAVFDEHDEFAQAIKRKVEQKIINMASIGINVIASSEDKSVIVQGQCRPTVIKSLITEASICDIGSNRNSLRLYDEFGATLTLSDNPEENHLLPLLRSLDTQSTIKNNDNMNLREQIVGALLLKDVATDEALVQQLLQLSQQVATQAALQARLDTFEKAEADRTEAAAVALVDEAIKERRILSADRESYLVLAREHFDQTKEILVRMPATADLSNTYGGGETPDYWASRKTEIRNNKNQ